MVRPTHDALSLSADQFWERFGRAETSTVDFKELLPKAGKLQEPLVAFANTRGGVVVCGVDEQRPRSVIGIDWGQEQAERVQETARSTQPPLHLASRLIDVDGRTVALIEVEALERGWVQTSDGRLLVRAGPTNRALVGDQLLRFVQERGADPAEDQPVRGSSLDDLRADTLRRYLHLRLRKQRVNVAQAARDLGLIAEDGRVRLSAILMFGKDPQRDRRRLGIDLTRHEGALESRHTFRDRRQLKGTLPELVEAADRAIYEEMRRDAVIRGLVREEVPEFPPVAIREALLNAVGHRDYSLSGSAVEVRLFDDAIEIESPGTLAGWVTVENLRDAQYSRNPRIMEIFHDLNLVEEAGTGIDRMLDAMEAALLDPPEFIEKSHSFVVRFRGRSVFAAEDRLWISGFADLGLSGHAKVALVFARRNGAVTNEDLRALRALETRESRGILQALVSRGLLAPVGRGRGTRYVLGEIARASPRRADRHQQIEVVVAHARRNGSIANREVRGLLGVERTEALAILDAGVAQGLLEAVGERRARRYLPTQA